MLSVNRCLAGSFMLIDFYYSGNDKLLALKALRQVYPTYSIKRKIAFLVNALNLIFFRRIPQEFNQVSSFFSFTTGKILNNGAKAILLHKINQNGRVYGFEFSERAEFLTVTKIALTETSRSGIIRENEILRQLSKAKLPFLVPSIVSFLESKEASILCMSAVNRDFSIHNKSNGLPDFILTRSHRCAHQMPL